MATLQQMIADKFLKDLSDGDSVSAAQIEELRQLLKKEKRVKAEDFVKVFTAPEGGDVK